MKNTQRGFVIPLVIIAVLALIGGGTYLYTQSTQKIVFNASQLTVEKLMNATYNSGAIKLVDGLQRGEKTPCKGGDDCGYSYIKLEDKNIAFGDLNGDGKNDAVVVLTTGNSDQTDLNGALLAVVLNENGNPNNIDVADIRYDAHLVEAKVNSISIEDKDIQVTISGLISLNPTNAKSQTVQLTYRLLDGKLVHQNIPLTESVPGWKIYTNHDYGFTLSYPQDWTMRDMSEYDYEIGTRHFNVWFNGPVRSDLPSAPGLPVSYYFLIAGNSDTQKTNFLPGFGCFTTSDPKYKSGQSPCNAPVERIDEENSPEAATMKQIATTFAFTGEKGNFSNPTPSLQITYPTGGEVWSWYATRSVTWKAIGLSKDDEIKIGFRTPDESVCWYKTDKPITVGEGQVSFEVQMITCEEKVPAPKIGGKYKIQVVIPKYASGKGVSDTSKDFITIGEY